MRLKYSIPNVGRLVNLDKKGYQTVVTRALRKVARSGEVQANRQIRETFNISRKDVDNAITLKPASPSSFQAVIIVKGRRLPLVLFGARQTQKGVSVMVGKGNRKAIPHTFLATMKSGHQGVFERKGKMRLPVKELYTISVAEMFAKSANMEKLDAFIQERFPTVLEQELNYYLISKN